MTERPLIQRLRDPLPAEPGLATTWLGAKAVSLVEMLQRGLPVPPGFVLSTALFSAFEREGRLPDELDARLREEVSLLEERSGRALGDPDQPLLLAVQSGAPSSMPGMLDTVLNVGVSRRVADGVGRLFGSPRLALDLRRRFLSSYATAVLGVPHDAFGALLRGRPVSSLGDDELDALLSDYERSIKREAGEPVPDDAHEQLRRSIAAVLSSWHLPRAQKYREAHGLPEDDGTAVIVQAMVYGNLDARSGAGVAFSRHPSSGAPTPFGEWVESSQGDNLMSGRKTPFPLSRGQVRRGTDDRSLETAMPEVVEALRSHLATLEAASRDAVEVEFTIQAGELFLLQSRTAKRSAQAAARIAVDLHADGTLTRTAALRRIDPPSLRQLLTPRVPDPQALGELGIAPIARGLAASPGAASGALVLSPEAVAARPGADLILVRAETSADDVHTMRSVSGIITAVGGLTCHAAVVARAMGKPCIVGASAVEVDTVAKQVRIRASGDALEAADRQLDEGDLLTIDGTRGLVYRGGIPVEPAPASPHVEQLLEWADATRLIEVWAEAGTAQLAAVAARYGADRVLVGADLSIEEARRAVGEVGLVLRAGSDPSALLPKLRADRDRLLVSGPSSEVPDEIAVQIDRVLFGDALSLAIETVDPRPRAVVVAALDIPIARLRAACVEEL